MGEYIGDKNRKSGSTRGADTTTKQFTPVKSAGKGSVSGDTKELRSGTKPASDGSNARNSSGSAVRSGAKNGSGGAASAKKNASSAPKKRNSGAASAKKSASPSAKPSSAAKASAAKAPASTRNRSSTPSAAKNPSGSEKKAGSASNKTAAGGNTKNTNSKKISGKSKTAYSPGVEAKRSSREEQELRASEAARSIKKARRRRNFDRNRKLLNFMFYASIFVAVLAVVIIMSVTVLFGIENITVVSDGDLPYSSQEILSSCDVECGQNLFTAPISTAGEQIMSGLPYIETCTVTRRLPSTVIITVTAAKPIGVIYEEDGSQAVVSSGLRVLEKVVSSGDAPGVPRIYGIIISEAGIGETVQSEELSYITVAGRIVDTLADGGITLDSISFSSGGNITAMYDGRINIIIGTSSNLDEKLEIAKVMINEGKITKHESGDLNLSIDGEAIFTPDYIKEQHSSAQ